MLNKKHDEAERAVAEKKAVVETLEQELANSQDVMKKVKRQYNDILSWSELFATSPISVKKMIVSQLISAVRVSRDYEIEIDFKISERQLGIKFEKSQTRENGGEPKREKIRKETER